MIFRPLTRRGAGALILCVALLSPTQGAGANLHVLVSTIAGNGVAGNADGKGAEFMFPVAVAYDTRTHAVFVADASGQRIRRIDADGDVETVAGGGDPLASGLEVAGGYRDGPASDARFFRPTGLAFAPDGSLYVADSFNHCVRRIKNGIVSTVAGDPNRPGNADGDAKTASFREPRSLALAANGDLFVGDYYDGIRVIKPDGSVQSVPFMAALASVGVRGIALWPGQGGYVFAATRYRGIARISLTTHSVEFVATTPEHADDLRPAGLVATGADSVIISSVLWHAIYSVHFPASGGDSAYSTLLAGSDDRDIGTQLGGFADGAQARLFDPEGLALDSNGKLAIADAGNRRIRSMTLPAILNQRAEAPSRHSPYVVSILLSSPFDAERIGPESLPSQLEAQTRTGRTRTRVAFRAIRFPEGSIQQQLAYVKRLTRKESSLILWIVHPTAFGATPLNAVLPQIREAARASHVKVLVADVALGEDLGAGESTYAQFMPNGATSTSGNIAALDRFVKTLGDSGIPTLAAFEDAELAAHRPFYDPGSTNFSAAGVRLLATIVAKKLNSLHPWNSVK
jgi:hypothetical protein